MSQPRKHSAEQITAIRALAALRPKPPNQLIADMVGLPLDTVRYHADGRSKVVLVEPWAMDVLEASAAKFKGNAELAAYHLISAAKHLLKKTP